MPDNDRVLIDGEKLAAAIERQGVGHPPAPHGSQVRLGPEPEPVTLRFRAEPPGFVGTDPGPLQGALAREVEALADSVGQGRLVDYQPDRVRASGTALAPSRSTALSPT